MAAVLESVMETWIVSVEKQNKMRTEVVLRDMSEEGGAADIAGVETVVAEEELVLRQYCKLICQICGHEEDMLNRPWRTKATAVVYFRRFYLRHSLLHYDPRDMMLACIFLSGKVEHDFIDVDKLMAHHDKGSADGVLKMEFALLEGLQYDLQVHHAHSCVHGLVADMERDSKQSGAAAREGTGDTRAQMSTWAAAAVAEVDEILTSVVYLAYIPSVIAVYAVLKTTETQSCIDCEVYMSKRGSAAYTKLREVTRRVEEESVRATEPINRSLFKKTMKRLAKNSEWGKP